MTTEPEIAAAAEAAREGALALFMQRSRDLTPHNAFRSGWEACLVAAQPIRIVLGAGQELDPEAIAACFRAQPMMIAPPLEVQHGLGAGFPHVDGRCPACNSHSLFLGSGGFVTCARLDCPDPSAAADLLAEGGR